MNTHATVRNTVVADFAPASLPDRAAAYALDAASSIGRLAMRRVKRTVDVLNSEYNLTHWQRMLSAKTWTTAASVSDFLVPKNPALGLRKVDNRICRIAADDYYRYRAKALGELLTRHAGGTTEIVELGAGYNLLALHLHHPEWRLHGFDIAPNGVAAGREIAAHYGLSDRISLDIRSVDYQTELFSTLDDYERQGRVRILARERMSFASTIHNDGFLYCWEPT